MCSIWFWHTSSRMKIGFRIGTLLCSYTHNSMVAVFPNIAEGASARTHNCKRVTQKCIKRDMDGYFIKKYAPWQLLLHGMCQVTWKYSLLGAFSSQIRESLRFSRRTFVRKILENPPRQINGWTFWCALSIYYTHSHTTIYYPHR